MNPIIVLSNYPARAAHTCDVKILNTNPRRFAGGSIQGNKTNFLLDNSASTQSARTLPRAAIARALIVQVTRIDPLWLFYSNFGPALKASGSLIIRLRRAIQAAKQSFRRVTKTFHFFNLSAG